MYICMYIYIYISIYGLHTLGPETLCWQGPQPFPGLDLSLLGLFGGRRLGVGALGGDLRLPFWGVYFGVFLGV